MNKLRTVVWLDGDKVREAFSDAKSMSEIIERLGLAHGSASYINCKRAAERFGLNIPKPAKTTEAARFKNTRPLAEILVERSTYTNRQSLKKKLIKAGLKEDVCEICGQLPMWNNKPLVLQLDHINGVGDDNRIENLRIICPNCHTQTPTFGYRPNIR